MAITDFYDLKGFFGIKDFTGNSTKWKCLGCETFMFYIWTQIFVQREMHLRKFYRSLCSLQLYKSFLEWEEIMDKWDCMDCGEVKER